MKEKPVCGIYIHFPFCRSKCLYCDFHSFPLIDLPADEYLAALKKEIEKKREILSSLNAISIYFGGGTPSLWKARAIEDIIKKIDFICGESPKEITLEGNPESLNPVSIRDFRNAGINRISIGVQSFNDEALKLLGRIHTSKQAVLAIESAIREGLNRSVDILLCKPFDNQENVLKDLEQAVSYGCQHISAYMLTPEEGTPLKRLVDNGSIFLPDDSLSSEIFLSARNFLIKNGFEHYEISNFAVPNFRAVHNSLYWKGNYYVGVGAGAHSYLPPREGAIYPTRESCTLHPLDYIQKMQNGEAVHTVEHLDAWDLFKEFIITRFRLLDGFELRELEEVIPDGRKTAVTEALNSCFQQGLIVSRGSKITLSEKGILLSNDVFLSFFEATG